ncbi:winged helix-turn-helix transcriptional regulator [Roseinatronobacter alkalisoli]|nr:winged helix-turn-helix transcriptional regulator [Roseinatronobacter sp. HJB301]
MLIQQLRTLEDDGIVMWTIFPEVPPRVKYCLSDMRIVLSLSMEALIDCAFLRREKAARG